MISGSISGAELPTHFSTEKAQAAIDAAIGAGIVQLTGRFQGELPNITIQSVTYEQIAPGVVTHETIKAQIKNLACTAQETDAAKLIARQSEPTLLERIEQLEAEVAALKGK